MKKLDIGCGKDKLAGAIGIDANPRSDADVIHDMDIVPWPLPSDTFDYVRGLDVLEHVKDFIAVMEEIHRVARDGARVEIRMPAMWSRDLVTDPTHRRAGTYRTFDYFDPTKPLSAFAYSAAHFEVVSADYVRYYRDDVFARVQRRLDRLFVPLIQKHVENYEAYFAQFYPMSAVNYVLRVRKS